MKYLSLLLFISISFSQLSIEDNQIHHNFKNSSHGSNDEKSALIGWGYRIKKNFSFKKQPIILKKDDNIILINPNEKIKIVTNDGDIVIGKYLSRSLLMKQIKVGGTKNNSWYTPKSTYKILYNDIHKISLGSGNKSIQYGITWAACIAIPSFLAFQLSKDEWQEASAIMFGVLSTPYVFLAGLKQGLSIPSKFEDPISIGVNEWKIISENDQ